MGSLWALQFGQAIIIINNMIMQSAGEKRLIQIFKTFVEKAIVPQIRKLEGSLVDWNKFSSLLFVDNPNHADLQLFVDSLPIWGSNSADKLQPYSRKSQLEALDVPSFNPNKTFGGERNKPNIFPVMDPDIGQTKQRDDSMRQRSSQANNNIFANLEKVLKSLQQNQTIIESMGKVDPRGDPSPSIRISSQNSQNNNQYGGTQAATQSYNYVPLNSNPLINPNISLQSHSHSQPHLQSGHSANLSYHKAYY